MVNIPFPTRLQRLRGKRSIPGAGIFALWPVGKAFWWLVEKGGDLDFIATYTPKASKMLPVIGAWMWDHGWLVLMPTGLAWLGWLVMRPEKDAALAEYKKVKDPALAEYKKVRAAALAEYEAAKSEQPTGRILDAEGRAERTEIQLRELAEQYRTREGELQNATAKIQELSREVREQKRLAGNAEGAAVLCKEQLANAVLDVLIRDERTVRRWLAGDSPMPTVVLERLAADRSEDES